MTRGDSLPVEIVGGGLAGLALGLALRRRDVPVTVFEAHDYPRHRVCGEFIAALDAPTVAQLGLAPILDDALRLREVVWYQRDRPIQTQQLPAPALGISRHRLDARLAEAFVAAGGRAARAHADGACRRAGGTGFCRGPPGPVLPLVRPQGARAPPASLRRP